MIDLSMENRKKNKMMDKILKTSIYILIGMIIITCLYIPFDYLNTKINCISESINKLQNNINTETKERKQADKQEKQDRIAGDKKLQNNDLEKTIINNILNSSVIVYGREGLGSGTVIKKTKKEMYILTCHHVIKDVIDLNNDMVKVIVAYSKYKYENNKYKSIGQILYTGEIYKNNELLDLTILKVNFVDENLIEVKLAENEPKLGDIIYTVGNPLGVERNLSKGIISNIVDEFYISDGTVTLGNSGGGLFNDKGELIGVPEKVPGYMLSPESGMGMSINLKIIKEFVKGVI